MIEAYISSRLPLPTSNRFTDRLNALRKGVPNFLKSCQGVPFKPTGECTPIVTQ